MFLAYLLGRRAITSACELSHVVELYSYICRVFVDFFQDGMLLFHHQMYIHVTLYAKYVEVYILQQQQCWNSEVLRILRGVFPSAVFI